MSAEPRRWARWGFRLSVGLLLLSVCGLLALLSAEKHWQEAGNWISGLLTGLSIKVAWALAGAAALGAVGFRALEVRPRRREK
jgi:autotransporter translocation and assembly factor TamB